MTLNADYAAPGPLRGIDRETAGFLRQVFESITDTFYVIDAETYEVVLTNAPVSTTTEESLPCCYALSHGRKTRCSGIEHPCPMLKVRETMQPTVVEHTHGVPGVEEPVEVRAYPIFDPAGKLTHVIEYCMDITERKRIEREMLAKKADLELCVSEQTGELRALEELSNRILNTVTEGIAQTDTDGNFQYLNPAAAALTGHRPEELLGTPLLDRFPRDLRPTFEETRSRCTPGPINSFESELLHRDGSRVPVLVSGAPSPDGDLPGGTLYAFTGLASVRTIQDSLRRRLREFSALASMSRKVTASLAPDRVVQATLDGIIEAIKPEFAALYVMDGERLVLRGFATASGGRLGDGGDQEHPPGFCVCARAAFSGKELFVADLEIDQDPEYANCSALGVRSLAAVPLRFGDTVLGAIGVGSTMACDFSEHRAFLDALASQVGIAIHNAFNHQRLTATLNALPDLVFEVEADGLITSFHTHDVDELALPPDSFLGRRVKDVLPKDAADQIMGALDKAVAKGTCRGVAYSLPGPNGPRHYELSIAAKDTDASRPPSFVALCRDVTEKREFEQRSQHARKMEAIGRFAARVAHDFNNSLMVIQGGIDLLERERQADPSVETADIVEVLRRATRNAAQLTRSMLGFSRHRALPATETDLEILIEETLPLIRRLLPQNIELNYVPQTGLPSVRCELALIQNALLNLCSNSRDAMPDGGVITIQTGSLEIDDTYVREHPWAVAGRYVFFAVTDTGVGMDEATVSTALDPFFTTKGPGEGTGLGLSSTYGDLKRHGGMIDIVSEVGAGTTCVAYLPALGPHRKVEDHRHHDSARGGTETVVVVDDDDDLRLVLTGLLEGLGYQVLTLNQGTELLRLLDTDRDTIDLVLSDLIMPHMTGEELCSRCREVVPELRFLFCSGSGSAWLEMDDASKRGSAFLKKPFDIDALADAVRGLLEEKKQ